MAVIDNWAFVGTTGIFDTEINRSRYTTCFMACDPLKVEVGSKWNSVCGVANRFGDYRDGRLTLTSSISIIDGDCICTDDGKIYYLGEKNPSYGAFEKALKKNIPILRNVTLTKDFNGCYNICGHMVGNNHKIFKKCVSQDSENNIIYFSDDSKAFIDWIGAKFDERIKYELISKKIGFREFAGVSIIPIF